MLQRVMISRLPGMQKAMRSYHSPALTLVSLVLAAVSITACENDTGYSKDFNHAHAFTLAGERIADEDPFAPGKTEITILYPGAGAHAAVLHLGHAIAEGLPRIRTVNFILTDIDRASFERLKSYLERGDSRLPVIARRLVHRSVPMNPGREERLSFEDDATGRGYNVVYALDRSNPESDVDPESGRILYYTKADFDRADVLVHHDSSNTRQVSTFLSDFMVSLAESPADHARAIVIEDLNSSPFIKPGERRINYELLPARVFPVNSPFGCRQDDPSNRAKDDHLGMPQYRRSTVIFPQTQVWRKLSRMEVKAFLTLALANAFPDAGPFLSEGQQAIFLDLIPELHASVLATLSSLRERLPEVAPERIRLFDHQMRSFRRLYRRAPVGQIDRVDVPGATAAPSEPSAAGPSVITPAT